MSYSELTIENPSLLKRFSHTKRFDIALELLAVERNDEILDYGTGDGFMLKKLLSANPQSVVGYEPMESQYKQLEEFISKQGIDNVAIIGDLSCIETSRFDKICCLEVLEHLTEDNQILVLTSIKCLLKNGGRAVVSVPIEVGLSGLLKNIARCILRQAHPNTTFLNIFKSFLCLKIERGQEAYISSHIGFDYHDLEGLIVSVGFEIKSKHYSPLKGFRGFINSQIFFVLESEVNTALNTDAAR